MDLERKVLPEPSLPDAPSSSSDCQFQLPGAEGGDISICTSKPYQCGQMVGREFVSTLGYTIHVSLKKYMFYTSN